MQYSGCISPHPDRDSGAAPTVFSLCPEYNARLCEWMAHTIAIKNHEGDSLSGVFRQCAIASRAQPNFLKIIHFTTENRMIHKCALEIPALKKIEPGGVLVRSRSTIKLR